MIREKSRLAGFLYIDRCCEGIHWSRPQDDEEYVAIPYGHFDVGAPGCIEIYKKGKLLYAVNLTEVAIVAFYHENNHA